MGQALSMEFLHFAHLPINIKISDLRSLSGMTILCKTMIMYRTKSIFSYKTIWHLRLAINSNLSPMVIILLKTYFHFQESFERSALVAYILKTFIHFLNF